MKLILSDLPETHEQSALWLERQIVGMELSRLVTELAALHGAARPTESVRTVLASDIHRVLSGGLQTLSTEQLRKVMVQPFHLFELQELVFSHGGPYWRAKESELDLRQRVEADWRRLKAALPSDPAKPLPPPPTGRARLILGGVLCLLLGSTLGFVGCYLWLNGPEFPPKPHSQTAEKPTSTAWGWNKPDAVSKADSPQEYLNRLATLVEEWSTVVPAENAPNRKLQLVIRLLELRSGCTRLSFTEHPLPAEQRDKLKASAIDWCEKIDELVQKVQKANDVNAWIPFIDILIHQIADDLRAG